ncbi:MAG: response regulator transcription factor [Bryobacteraceae bacterium]|jgi:DNA-binding NarL/FixJ family response regulator
MQPIRLLLVDDHVLFREGVSRLLATEPDLEAVAQCGTAEEALAFVARTPIDIVLLDYDLDSETGTRFISDASARGFQGKILMVTAGMNGLQCSLAWRLGISGIAMKRTSPAKLLDAIRKVAAGGIWNDEVVISRVGNPGGAKATPLTPRERQVLRGVLEGQTNRDIAYNLGASLGSVKAALQQLFDKTGVRTRSQLVRIAIERSIETGVAPRTRSSQ